MGAVSVRFRRTTAQSICCDVRCFQIHGFHMEGIMSATTETDLPRSDAGLRPTDARLLQRPATSILIVDAHFLIREALCDTLKQVTGNVRVIEATGGQQAMQSVSEHSQIDLVLLE